MKKELRNINYAMIIFGIVIFGLVCWFLIYAYKSSPDIQFCNEKGYNFGDIRTAERRGDVLSCNSKDDKLYHVKKECIEEDKFRKCITYKLVEKNAK